MQLNPNDLKEFLDLKVAQYNTFDFIESDPVGIPHRFKIKEDIEIAGFLASSIAWGNRKMIVKNGHRMLDLLGNSPYDFVMNHNENQLENLDFFVHRTFNALDFKHFIKALQHIYTNKNGLETIFFENQTEDSLQNGILALNNAFFEIPHLQRTQKHVANPTKGSAAKRINMFLRWMVRKDNKGVDFGIWQNLQSAQLICPCDVHVERVARKLNLISRPKPDWAMAEELTANLRQLDPTDPVKYDFALFGMGVEGEM